MLRRHTVPLTAIRPSDGDVKPGGPLVLFEKRRLWADTGFHLLPSFHHHPSLYFTNTYTYSHSDLNFLQYTRQSSFSSIYDTSLTSQFILQPFHYFTYVTTHSPTLLSLLLHHKLSTYVNWRAANEVSTFLFSYLDQCKNMFLFYYFSLQKPQRLKTAGCNFIPLWTFKFFIWNVETYCTLFIWCAILFALIYHRLT